MKCTKHWNAISFSYFLFSMWMYRKGGQKTAFSGIAFCCFDVCCKYSLSKAFTCALCCLLNK